jgi:3-hydroxyisobutyrate dehydrogenase-like beta-hydroxyacid dehydrogenase
LKPEIRTGPAGPARESKAVGIIGMGLMGGALRKMLGDAGFAIRGWDRDASRCVNARTAADVFDACDRVFLCLPDSEACGSALGGAALRAGQIIIDTTTGDPREMAALGAGLAARGAHYLDATISGNSAQLLQHDVLVMAGGDADVFEQCRDLFAAFAREAAHIGPCGSGAKMKLVTNLVLGLNRAALAEGLAFAQQLDLNPAQALDIMRRSMAYSRIMDTKGKKMVEQDFTPQAKLAQHLKDVRLMLAASPLHLPLSETHCRLLEEAVGLGYGELDNSAVIKVIQEPPP